MGNLTPKIDDALNAVIDLLGIKDNKDGLYYTKWGKKSMIGLNASIVNKLREYGVKLTEDASV